MWRRLTGPVVRNGQNGRGGTSCGDRFAVGLLRPQSVQKRLVLINSGLRTARLSTHRAAAKYCSWVCGVLLSSDHKAQTAWLCGFLLKRLIRGFRFRVIL